jgi:hypothetical protein
MKLIGFLLLAVGCVGVLVSLNMDVTVGVESQVNGWTQVERVNNIGRMDERRNWLIVSGFAVITGAVFVGFGTLADKRRPTMPSLELAAQQSVPGKRSRRERIATVFFVIIVIWMLIGAIVAIYLTLTGHR